MCRLKLENNEHQIINLDFNDLTELADFMDSMEPVLNLEDIQITDYDLLTNDQYNCDCAWCANYQNN